MEHRITQVEEESIGFELGIEPGDTLLSVNGEDVEDVFDYRFLIQNEEVVLLIRKPDGEEWELEIEKDPYEDLGIVFGSGLMSEMKSCRNRCIFCFIDQMPKGMRKTLYFKDDDSRLSFLQGNYITLTNMKPRDVERIIRYRLEPMNISVHTTDPELRVKMLKNRHAGEVLSYIQAFYEAGLRMNMQIVLCKGVNDGPALEKTLRDLYAFFPVLESVSIVPVGITRHRDGLPHLETPGPEDAREVIRLVEEWQEKAYEEHWLHFVHASDELYITAGLPFPEEERYDGYLQLENGVGMLRLFLTEAEEALPEALHNYRRHRTSYASGMLPYPMLLNVKERLHKETGHPEDNLLYAVRNDFFGDTITVSGLVTGQDLVAQLKGKDLGDLLLLPNCMFRSGEEVFLDDMTRADVERELGVRTMIMKNDARTFLHALSGNLTDEDIDTRHGEYEPGASWEPDTERGEE
ncbi:MAG: DUF512 domain-containing protein [Lachnospiraceae bacterium]|nr:DUF512 domain-containing protein [Lachnospiraceae bacterium]